MEIYGVAIIIALIAVSYIAGMMTANWYNSKANRERDYALEKQYLRLRAGTDFYDPAGPYLARPLVSGRINAEKPFSKSAFTPEQLSQFAAGLKDKGSATIMLGKDNVNPTTTK